MTRWTIILTILLGQFFSSCHFHNLRTKWTSDTCPKHSKKLKDGLVKTIPSGPAVRPRTDAIPYMLHDSLPLQEGNAKLKYQEIGCVRQRLQYAKIKYCPDCHHEYKQWLRTESKQYDKDWKYEKSDTARALALLTCLQFLVTEKYIDSLQLNSFYIVKNRFTDKSGITSNKLLKDRILSKDEIKKRGLKNFMEITKFEYPPKRWEWHKVLITYTIYPQDIILFSNLERVGDSWTMNYHRRKN